MPRTLPKRIKEIVVGLNALLLSGTLAPLPVTAHPGTSPSARAAARLKYRPPAGWIRHYLPDDRYKIGTTWKVVSTELDTVYHRPDCPDVLQQPAGSVIGFASPTDAGEAGYGRCSRCLPLPRQVLTARERVTPKDRVRATEQVRRIVLADGVSSLILPPNWRHLESSTVTANGYTFWSDLFQPRDKPDQGMFVTTGIGPTNLEPSFHVGRKRPGITNLRLWNLKGKIMRLPASASGGATVNFSAVRGSKMYSFQMGAVLEQEPGLQTMLKSYRPR